MASRENPKADSQTTNELNILDNQSLYLNTLARLQWQQAPFCWLTDAEKSLLQQQAEVRQYRIGEKIWSSAAGGNQFLMITGKVRLRQEKEGKALTALAAGDWFGDLSAWTW